MSLRLGGLDDSEARRITVDEGASAGSALRVDFFESDAGAVQANREHDDALPDGKDRNTMRPVTRRAMQTAAVLATMTMIASGCSSGVDAGSASETLDPSATVDLTLAGWSLGTTPEFQTLVDGFEAEHPNVSIDIKEYDPNNYETQLTADLSAGSAPDLFPIKNLKYYYTWGANDQLADVSDVAAQFENDEHIDISSLKLEDNYFALPYRQDSWLLFYNKDLFAEAGVDEPDGTWTWDDYGQVAGQLTDAFRAAGRTDVYGAYQHTWQSVVQGYALAQTEGADLTTGDLSYLKEYYERALALQDAGSTLPFAQAQANQITYQSQFGTQKAAMLPMGTWYIAAYLAQRESGDADAFNWGLAPAPQRDSSTLGENITFADPTSWAVSARSEGQQLAAAKEFLAYASGEGGATALAAIGITPAYYSDAVVDAIFGLEGMPDDELSKTAFTDHDTRPENPLYEYTSSIQDILKDTHSAIMTESTSIDDALASTEQELENNAYVGQ